MGRELKCVPLDFNWPLKKVWHGYLISFCQDNRCDDCKKFAKMKGMPFKGYGCPDTEPIFGPPAGEGYQLWETTSEGSPYTPVFATLDELCEWCADNATTFANEKTTKEKWKAMLDADFVYHQEGSVVFI